MDQRTVSRAKSLVQEKEASWDIQSFNNPGTGGFDEKEHDGADCWWESISHWEPGTLKNNVKLHF